MLGQVWKDGPGTERVGGWRGRVGQMFNHNSATSVGWSSKCWARRDEMGLTRVGRWQGTVGWTERLCTKDIQHGVGCDQEIKKKGRWDARELAWEGFWVFQNLPLFLKKSLCS
jgi:hypothetical protein